MPTCPNANYFAETVQYIEKSVRISSLKINFSWINKVNLI
jgi:hypothetical protein